MSANPAPAAAPKQPPTYSPEELAYALSLINANGVAGLNDPTLSPDSTAQDAIYRTGIERLKANGGMLPADRPDTWHLDEGLLQAVLVLSDPSFVVRTAQEVAPRGRAIYHYLAPDGIVEVAQLVDDRYALANIRDIAMVAERSAFLLDAAGADSKPPANLESTSGPRGEIIVARARRTQLEAGRKAITYGHQWLSYRRSANTTDVETRALTTANIKAVIETFLDYLGGQPNSRP